MRLQTDDESILMSLDNWQASQHFTFQDITSTII